MSNIPDKECAEVEGKATKALVKCEVTKVLLADMEITKAEATSFPGNNLTRKYLFDPGEDTFIEKGPGEAQGCPPADTCAGVDKVCQPLDN